MKPLIILLQATNAETPKLIEKTKPLDFENLYTLGINWLMLNGPRILIAIAVFFVGQWIIRFFRKWLQKSMFKRNVQSSVKPFLESLIIAAIQIFLFIVV